VVNLAVVRTEEQLVLRAAEAALARIVLASCLSEPGVSMAEVQQTMARSLRSSASGWVQTDHRVYDDARRARVGIAMLHQGQITLIELTDHHADLHASIQLVQDATVRRSDGYPASDTAYVISIAVGKPSLEMECLHTFQYSSTTVECSVSVIRVSR